jgi:hypothetical protein
MLIQTLTWDGAQDQTAIISLRKERKTSPFVSAVMKSALNVDCNGMERRSVRKWWTKTFTVGLLTMGMLGTVQNAKQE